MSGSTAKIVPEINLDEFERRLRSAGATPGGAEDPLAELTRLVNLISRENNKGDPVARSPQARMPKAAGLPAAANDEPVARFEPGSSRSGRRRGAGRPASVARPRGREAASRRRRRPRSVARGPRRAVGGGRRGEARKAPPEFLVFQDGGSGGGRRRAARRRGGAEVRRRPRPSQDAAVHRGRRGADQGPAAERRDRAVGRRFGGVADEGFGDVRAGQGRLHGRAAGRSARADAESGAGRRRFGFRPSPASPRRRRPPPRRWRRAADTPIVAARRGVRHRRSAFPRGQAGQDGFGASGRNADPGRLDADAFAAPCRRPSRPTRAERQFAGGRPPPAATAEPATPKLDLPTKLSPKSSARIVAKTDTTAPAAATETTPNAPLQLGSPARRPRPRRRRPAKSATADADPTAATAAPAQTAATEPAGAGAGWAVQLAAPRSEEDAQRAISRLKSKYADALGGAELGVRQADVKGETIYRVRAGDLSKTDAAALCSKLKASGGDCFVAKN